MSVSEAKKHLPAASAFSAEYEENRRGCLRQQTSPAVYLNIKEIKEACDYAHSLGKKVYVTVNIIFHNEDTIGLVEYLKELSLCNVDAIIVADPLVIKLVHDNNIKLNIHISTQSSTLNYLSVLYWKKLGVERVVLGRELNREEIKEIIDKTGIEVECFIHGAMCS